MLNSYNPYTACPMCTRLAKLDHTKDSILSVTNKTSVKVHDSDGHPVPSVCARTSTNKLVRGRLDKGTMEVTIASTGPQLCPISVLWLTSSYRNDDMTDVMDRWMKNSSNSGWHIVERTVTCSYTHTRSTACEVHLQHPIENWVTPFICSRIPTKRQCVLGYSSHVHRKIVGEQKCTPNHNNCIIDYILSA